MPSIEQYLIRARYALEPNRDADREEFGETTDEIILSLYDTLRPLKTHEREAVVSEIEAMATGRIIAETAPNLIVVNGGKR